MKLRLVFSLLLGLLVLAAPLYARSSFMLYLATEAGVYMIVALGLIVAVWATALLSVLSILGLAAAFIVRAEQIS